MGEYKKVGEVDDPTSIDIWIRSRWIGGVSERIWSARALWPPRTKARCTA